MVANTQHRDRTGCPVACALDIIGDHWTLLIIRNLLFLGLHEYKDMLTAEERISSNILTRRLKALEKDGLVASVPHPESRRRKLYYLTPMGKDLARVLVEISRWSNRHLGRHLAIPPDIRALLENDPDRLTEMMLAPLDAWEAEHLPPRRRR